MIMDNVITKTFNPDYAVHPGEILEEILDARGMKKNDFAERSGLSDKTVSQIINCKDFISPETAIKIERVLDIPASVWTNINTIYRIHNIKIEEKKKIFKQINWAKEFPYKELIKRKYIELPVNHEDLVEKILRFFSVASVDSYNGRYNEIVSACAYRKSPSFNMAPQSVATWLRVGEIKSINYDTNIYNKDKFMENLYKIKELTRENPESFEPTMKALCAEAGVALIIEPEFSKTRLFGATFWASKDKAIIMLSLRYKTNDQLWFSLFHEAAHILFHSKKQLFIEEAGNKDTDNENEADSWASEFLLPKKELSDIIKLSLSGLLNRRRIINKANKLGIAPGILVGRMQHEGIIGYHMFNDLKRRFKIVKQ